jgi:hypothetical protein
MTQRLATTKQSDTAPEQLKSSSPPVSIICSSSHCTSWTRLLFYSSYMNLSDRKAATATLALIQNALRLGGVLTINWYDRSLGPDRLWGDAYVTLLNEFRARTPSFATAAQTVAWFRKRREATFACLAQEDTGIRVQPSTDRANADLPPLAVRVYNSSAWRRSSLNSTRATAFEDFILGEADPLLIAA